MNIKNKTTTTTTTTVPVYRPFSVTTLVSRYQKSKFVWIRRSVLVLVTVRAINTRRPCMCVHCLPPNDIDIGRYYYYYLFITPEGSTTQHHRYKGGRKTQETKN